MNSLKSIPVLPLRDIVVFPNVTTPLFVGREKSISALENVMQETKKIFLVAQKNPDVASFLNLYTILRVCTNKSPFPFFYLNGEKMVQTL